KIHQFTLNDLPIDYNFKYVTRFDRCMTCHQGIDRANYTKENLVGLLGVSKAEVSRLNKARDTLQLRKRQMQILVDLKQASKSPLASVPSPDELRELKPLEPDDLTAARVKEFCAHPRLDLFVGSNSKHPAETFGCSSCHGGQGSPTSFVFAAHTPNDTPTMRKWKQEAGWVPEPDWGF